MDASLTSVRCSNLNQFRTNGFVAVNRRMASGTEGNQIVRMIVGFVLINMMHMQSMSPSLALFLAKLTSPFVSIFNLLAKTLPVGRVIPLGNATFPCRIIRSRSCAACKQGLASCTSGNASFLHGLNNRSAVNANLLGDFFYGANFSHVFVVQPIRIVIIFLWSIVTWSIFLPKAIFAYPFCLSTTTTGTQGCGRIRLIDGFAGSALAGFGLTAMWIPMFGQ